MAKKRLDSVSPQDREIIIPNVQALREIPVDDRGRIIEIAGAVICSDYIDLIHQATEYQGDNAKTINQDRSAHEVGFGKFVGRRQDKLSRTGHLLSVATKPMHDRDSAIREVTGAQWLIDHGIETYEPVGVFQTKSGNHAFVSKKRSDLMGLDRDKWVVGRHVTSEREAVIAKRNDDSVRDISSTFPELHARGFFHPDGQIKNWGVTPDRTIGAFDLERHKQVNPDTPEGLSEYAWYDLEKLIASLISNDKGRSLYGVGMLHGLPEITVRKGIEDLILDPYFNRLNELYSSGYSDEAMSLYDGIQARHDSRANYILQRVA